jgi:Lrp/AsnC family transcriptional regulator of ectoine degradation
MKLDRTDLKILKYLQTNAKTTNQDLAEKIALSPSSCLQRVRRLEQEELITGYHAKLNLSKISRHIMFIATVTMKNHSAKEFRKFESLIESLPEIIECYTVSGEFDFFIRIVCPDMTRYVEINDILVESVNHSLSINTHVVMNENKSFTGVDLSKLSSDLT